MKKQDKIVFYHDVDIKDVEPVNYIDINFQAFDVDKAIPDPFIIKKGKEEISDIWVKDNKLTKAYKREYREIHNEKTTANVYVPKFPLAFDIETTTIIDYEKDKRGRIKYDDTGAPMIARAEGYAYHWQILVNETVVHCKSWTECMTVFRLVCNKLRLSAFVEGIPNHVFKARCLIANMGFEFQFMNQHFLSMGDKWTKIFAISNRSPLIAETDSGFVFQDALKISNSSLEKLSKLYSLPSKKSHDLDYSLVRNTKTTMTDEEINYCSLDVRILGDFHRWIMQNYHANGLDYPLTSTGLLRDTLGKYFEITEFKTKEYTKNGKKKTYKELSRFAKTIPDLFPDTYDEYADTMLFGFRGGYTHANVRNANRILENVNGGDFTSSYPYVMMFQKFPVSKFESCRKDISVIEHLIKKGRAVMMKLRFHGLENLTSHSLESVNKTWEYKECGKSIKEFVNKTNSIVDNGRVLCADVLTVSLTDIDYESYKMFYKWDSVEVLEAKSAQYGLLPDYVRLSVSTYYHFKKILKRPDDEEQTTEYKLSKAMVNANYGLMCEKLHINEIVFDPERFMWYESMPQDKYELQQAYIDEIYGKNKDDKKYNKRPKTILSPYWGIWTTAHARNNLFQILMKISDKDSIYCDTDSIYFLNPEKNWAICEEYNKKVMNDNLKLIKEWNEKWGFDIDEYNKMNPDEQKKYVEETHGLIPDYFADLGTFDKLNKIGNYTRFKTLGAKRYVKEWYDKKGELKVEQTIAGLPKTALCEYCKKNDKDPFAVFKNGMSIKNVKKAHAYNDRPHTREITDYQGNTETMTEYASVGIFDVSFSMKMDSAYTRLILSYVESIKRKDLREYIRQGDKK